MKVAGSDKRRNLFLIFYTSGWCWVITWEERNKDKKGNILVSFFWWEELEEWLHSKMGSQVIISNWRHTHPGHSKGLHLARVSTQLAELHWLSATVNLLQTQDSANVSTSSVCSCHTVVSSAGCGCTVNPTLSLSRASTCGMSSEVLAPTGQSYF